MKKIVMTMGAFFALSGAIAQGPYASLSVGYAGGTASDVIGVDYNVTSATAFTKKNIVGTYGSGVPVTLGLGYMFTEHMGFDLGINYFAGSEVTSDITNTFFGSKSITTSQGYQIRIIPQMVISTGSDNALSFYAKTGFVLPVSGETTFMVDAVDATSGTPVPTVVKGESSGSFSFGYTGSLGASYNLSDNLSLFGELQGINLRIKGESRTLTSYVYDGNEVISTLPESATKTNYVDELNQSSNSDPLKAVDALATTTNYSSFGFNLGIKFNF